MDRREEIAGWVRRSSEWNPGTNPLDFGESIRFTQSDLSDQKICDLVNMPGYVSELKDKMGRKCTITAGSDVFHGTFIGISADFTDFYYAVESDDSVVHNFTSVCGIKFDSNDNSN